MKESPGPRPAQGATARMPVWIACWNGECEFTIHVVDPAPENTRRALAGAIGYHRYGLVPGARENEETNAYERSKSRECALREHIDSAPLYHNQARRPKAEPCLAPRNGERLETPDSAVTRGLSFPMMPAIHFSFEETDVPVIA